LLILLADLSDDQGAESLRGWSQSQNCDIEGKKVDLGMCWNSQPLIKLHVVRHQNMILLLMIHSFISADAIII